ncbi:MAG: hypothetical protein QN122_13530 [Armatimonadota bacterium]|nr:hypothetical protein [Armatimonadota bacterium]
MDLAALKELVAGVGFPIAVSLWLLYWLPRMSQQLDRINQKLDLLCRLGLRDALQNEQTRES